MNVQSSRWLVAGVCLLMVIGDGALAAETGAARPEGRPSARPPTARRENLFLDGFFPIGVFSQPVESFETWKKRGINTLLETPQNHDAVAWDGAARRAGFKVIRRPLPNPRDDIARTDLLAWSHWDEPDAAGRAPEWTPLFEKTFKEWRQIDPQRKVFLNLAGPDLTWFCTRTDAYSRDYASYYPRLIASADWIANDLYPCGGWLNQAHQPRRGDVTLVVEPLKLLRTMTDKPLFAFIETSEVEKGNVAGARAPSADEVRAELWLAVIHGVRGVFYFPAVVGTNGFRFDGTPAETVAEITKNNSWLEELAPVLQGPVNPEGLAVAADADVHVGWRNANGKVYVFAVNPRPTHARKVTLKFTGPVRAKHADVWKENRRLPVTKGAVVDDFEPLGLHVYVFE